MESIFSYLESLSSGCWAAVCIIVILLFLAALGTAPSLLSSRISNEEREAEKKWMDDHGKS